MTMITDMIARGWEGFLARPEGPLNVRFILQPAIGALMALRAGIKDAREGRPAYLWSAFSDATQRWQLLHGGWKDMRTTFLISAMLDAVYQIIGHRGIYLLELLFTATLLALVPYFVLRGPVNRIARLFMSGGRGAAEKTADISSQPESRD
jgi:hypothetical protein